MFFLFRPLVTIVLFATIIAFHGTVHAGQLQHYVFSGVTPDKPELADRSGAAESADLKYTGKTPFEISPNDESGYRGVRLDSGWFESKPFEVQKSFTVEMRVRILGQGVERGNNGSENGTLFGIGDGYSSGTRLVFDTKTRTLGFAIGRPAPVCAFHVGGRRPIPAGIWTHIAASWDGKEMKIFVDGFPYASGEYDGEYSAPIWNFRIGFNDAGVGSLKMDIAELAVHSEALDPATLLSHALSADFAKAEPLNNDDAAKYAEILEHLAKRNWTDATAACEAWNPAAPCEHFPRFLRAEISSLAGRSGEALVLFSQIATDTNSPLGWKEAALIRCLPDESRVPLVISDVSLYDKLLKAPGISDSQRIAIKKSLVRSLKLAGKFREAAETAVRYGIDDDTTEYAEAVRTVIERKYVPDYKALETRELAAETARIKENKSPWEPVRQRNPLASNFKPTVRYHVAPDGKAENPGTEEKPFGSLVQARDAIRVVRSQREQKGESPLPAGGVEVLVRGGTYQTRESFKLESRDSGTEEAPIVYRNSNELVPVFEGGIVPGKFEPLADPAILKRLPEESRNKVWKCDLSLIDFDFKKLPPMNNRGYGANGPHAAPWVDFYINDRPMQLARFPNEPAGIIDENAAFMRTGEVVSEHRNGSQDREPGVFRYTDARCERWGDAADVWLLGYWKHLWAATLIKLEKIDPEKKELTVATGANPYGYVKNAPFYAINLFEEIDVPGEWYLDRKSGVLYVYPPDGVNLNSPGTKLSVSALPEPFVQLKDVSHTSFFGLVFEDGCSSGADVQGGTDVLFAGCVFRRLGVWGVSMNGTRHGVLSCDVFQLGGGGIWMNGGDIRTLSPGGCFIENNHIADLTRVDRVYGPAVSMDGVGNSIAHNLMHDSPAHGMRMGGFSHIVEFNEIHSVVYESDDQSGIDLFGDPSLRENIIRYNYWHHIGSGRDVAGQSGIRLDDMISSVLMYGNVFYRSSGGQFGGIQIHGGKNNVADNNLFIDCKSAFSFSPWSDARWHEMLEKGEPINIVRSSGSDIDKEPFKSRFPDYAEIRNDVNRNFLLRNIAIGCGEFARNEHWQNVLINNLNLPHEEIAFDQLGRPVVPYDWSGYAVIGMRPVPIEKMGLYTDRFRKALHKSEITKRYFIE